MTIDDSHRDFVVAASKPAGMGYVADASRLVDFVGSTPAGDMALGELRGPLADETLAWLMRISAGVKTVHATAVEGHDRLMLAKAYDLSARIKKPVALPIAPDDVMRGNSRRFRTLKSLGFRRSGRILSCRHVCRRDVRKSDGTAERARAHILTAARKRSDRRALGQLLAMITP